jgi:hypothetical protein
VLAQILPELIIKSIFSRAQLLFMMPLYVLLIFCQVQINKMNIKVNIVKEFVEEHQFSLLDGAPMIRSLYYFPGQSVRKDIPPQEFPELIRNRRGLLWVDFTSEAPEICLPIPGILRLSLFGN